MEPPKNMMESGKTIHTTALGRGHTPMVRHKKENSLTETEPDGLKVDPKFSYLLENVLPKEED